MTTFYFVLMAIFAIAATLAVVFVVKTAKETAKADSKWKDYVLIELSRREIEAENLEASKAHEPVDTKTEKINQ